MSKVIYIQSSTIKEFKRGTSIIWSIPLCNNRYEVHNIEVNVHIDRIALSKFGAFRHIIESENISALYTDWWLNMEQALHEINKWYPETKYAKIQ